MTTQQTLGFSAHLTHKANLKHTRYGWLRLTPAYSVHLVSEILETHRQEKPVVLDPFCGSGTTALVCAEKGVASATTDINPFLIWLAQTKIHRYSQQDRDCFDKEAARVAQAICATDCLSSWVPPLHQIEKWWDEQTLAALGRAMSTIQAFAKDDNEPVANLLKIAFCRVMIDSSNASFGHQSMSFKKSNKQPALLPHDASHMLAESGMAQSWLDAASAISQAACSPIGLESQVLLCDARNLTERFPNKHFSCVVTSPPYPNRMSYVRELRPYMYWLRYLETGRDAGELDWKAIGGTWGCATSNVGKWEPDTELLIPHEGFPVILKDIAEISPLLSRYVHKYFYDMVLHVRNVFQVLRPGGEVHYIVGNSKFYDVMLPVEKIFASLFRAVGFTKVEVRTIRKRTSKKELYEYVVSAKKLS